MPDTEDTENKVPLNFKIPRTLKARVRAEARRLGVAESAVVILALDKHLPEYDPRKQ